MESHEPPIQCPWEGCSRQLVTKISLYFHLKTHRGEYKCTDCPMVFTKQKPLEEHMEEAHGSKFPTEAEDLLRSEIGPASEIDLVQLICAGCGRGFDDEDQFAGHKCKTPEEEDSVAEVPDTLIPEQTETNPEDAAATEQVTEEETTELLQDNPVPVDQTVEDVDMLDDTRVLAAGEPAEEMMQEEESAPEKILDEADHSEVPTDSNMDEERKDFMEEGLLSITNQESNSSNAPFDEMVLVLGKDTDVVMDHHDFSMDGDKQEEASHEVVMDHHDFSLDGDKQEVEQEEGHPMLAELGVDEEVGEKAGLMAEEEGHQMLSELGVVDEDEEEGKKEELIDQEVDLESYEGAVLKVPTADGKMLLIPYSASDGTVSLQLPPGLTLDDRSLQLALEGAGQSFLQVEEEEADKEDAPSLEE